MSFDQLTRAQKRDLIRSENPSGPQITMPPERVDKLLADLKKTPKNKLFAFGYDEKASLRLIADNWAVDMVSFPARHHGRNFRPEGDWDMRTLATLAILSEFTQGQGKDMGVLTRTCSSRRWM